MYGHDDQSATLGAAEVVVAAADVGERKPGTLESADDLAPARAGQSAQEAATSSSTISGSSPAAGTGRPSRAAASR